MRFWGQSSVCRGVNTPPPPYINLPLRVTPPSLKIPKHTYAHTHTHTHTHAHTHTIFQPFWEFLSSIAFSISLCELVYVKTVSVVWSVITVLHWVNENKNMHISNQPDIHHFNILSHREEIKKCEWDLTYMFTSNFTWYQWYLFTFN